MTGGSIVYFSHGGGPLPILGDPGHEAMKAVAALLGARHPPLFYDYDGFPDEAYQLTYSAPGSPELAGRIVELLRGRHIMSRIDAERGFDHGLFIPLKLMYPQADIPSLQLSLVRGLDHQNDAFQEWLIETCTGSSSKKDREQALVDREKAPSARYCHPREEHLIPLHVCAGMSETEAKVIFDDRILGKRAIAFLWQ